MNASLITINQADKMVVAHCTIAEAAKRLDCSESTIRRYANRAGVKRIKDGGIKGFVLFSARPVDVAIAYAE